MGTRAAQQNDCSRTSLDTVFDATFALGILHCHGSTQYGGDGSISDETWCFNNAREYDLGYEASMGEALQFFLSSSSVFVDNVDIA